MRRLLVALLILAATPAGAQNSRENLWSSQAIRQMGQALTEGGYFGAPGFTTALLPTCDATNTKRGLAYDTTTNKIVYCNGTSWGDVGMAFGSTSGGTANRVLFTNSSGNVSDDADFTFLTDRVTVTKLGTTALDAANGVDLGATAGVITFEGSGVDTIESTIGVTNPTVGDQNFVTPNAAAAGTYTLGLQADVQTFTTPGANVWTKPAGAKAVCVTLYGGGGGGGGARGDVAGGVRMGGGGGGGGARSYACFDASQVATGGTETVTLGAGGPGGSGGTTADGSNGTAGANSTFGAHLTAGGGGFGPLGSNATNRSGGGGGGTGQVGGNGGTSNSVGGMASAAGIGIGGQGAGCTTANNGSAADLGGGAGGGTAGNGGAPGSGGGAIMGGGGGAGGGGLTAGNAESAGGTGGGHTFTFAGGGTAGTVDGGAGGAGTAGSSIRGADGGGGGGSQDSGTGGAGGAGGLCGGGGGGGGGGTTTGGAGGAGGGGCAVVVTYR